MSILAQWTADRHERFSWRIMANGGTRPSRGVDSNAYVEDVEPDFFSRLVLKYREQVAQAAHFKG